MTTLSDAMRRRTDAQAALTEIEVAFRNGELLVIEDEVEEMGKRYVAVRAKLMNIPTKAAPQLAHADKQMRLRLVQDLVNEAVAELSA